MDRITHLGIVEARHGYVTVAADTETMTRELAAAALRHTRGDQTHVYPIEDVLAETARPISTQYLHNIQHPFKSTNWHLWKGATPDTTSVVDWYTFLYPESRRYITHRLTEHCLQHAAADAVTTREDLPMLFNQALPCLTGHGLAHLLAEPVWHRFTQERPSQVQRKEKRIAANRRNGRDFEAFFEHLCTENGLHATPYATEKLREHYPDIATHLAYEHGNLHGMPDFFVDRGSHTTKTRGAVWMPDNRYAFVEVKYSQSPLTAEQETMLHALAAHGIETWLFKGTAEHYRFHHITPQHPTQMRVRQV